MDSQLRELLLLDAPEAAKRLIGWELLSAVDGAICGGIIIETEAYTSDDPASHSFDGQTQRNSAMFLGGGTLYVYQIYGLHACVNIVCGENAGQGVLLRMLQPTIGLEIMRHRRGTLRNELLCSGPGNLTQALGIAANHNCQKIEDSPLSLRPPRTTDFQVVSLPRVGISKARDRLWRYRYT